MKIAIIGSGISGLTCAWLLNKHHDIQVFESESRIGGHTATVDVEHKNKSYRIDTGFIVYNDWTYPNFIKLLEHLKVKSQKSNMSFSVMQAAPDFEYSGSSLGALFCQKRNMLKPSYWKMLLDIVRFNKIATSDAESGGLTESLSLGDYLEVKGFGQRFIDHYLIPMGSAIWSSSNRDIMSFSAVFFIEFFKNHGLLSIKNRPQWRVIQGGSSAYLKPLCSDFQDKIKLNTRINSVTRSQNKVQIVYGDGSLSEFDHVVFACHSDQALSIIKDPSLMEREILGSIKYSNNEVVLHTDTSLLPKRKAAWASWNYLLRGSKNKPPALSYNMNKLQSIDCEDTFVVTLNASELIAPDKVIAKFNYAHPQFSLNSKKAQNRWREINGNEHTSFCGAYWGNGFHEDGCLSGIQVARALGAEWDLA